MAYEVNARRGRLLSTSTRRAATRRARSARLRRSASRRTSRRQAQLRRHHRLLPLQRQGRPRRRAAASARVSAAALAGDMTLAVTLRLPRQAEDALADRHRRPTRARSRCAAGSPTWRARCTASTRWTSTRTRARGRRPSSRSTCRWTTRTCRARRCSSCRASTRSPARRPAGRAAGSHSCGTRSSTTPRCRCGPTTRTRPRRASISTPWWPAAASTSTRTGSDLTSAQDYVPGVGFVPSADLPQVMRAGDASSALLVLAGCGGGDGGGGRSRPRCRAGFKTLTGRTTRSPIPSELGAARRRRGREGAAGAEGHRPGSPRRPRSGRGEAPTAGLDALRGRASRPTTASGAQAGRSSRTRTTRSTAPRART